MDLSELSKNIIDKFYSFLIGEMTILEFEKWVYDSKELENELDEISSYDFMSSGFKKSGATCELEHLIRKHINISEYETWKPKKENPSCPTLYVDDHSVHCGPPFQTSLDKLNDLIKNK